MVRYLSESGLRVRIWFLGPARLNERSAIRRSISEAEVAFMQVPWLDAAGTWWAERNRKQENSVEQSAVENGVSAGHAEIERSSVPEDALHAPQLEDFQFEVIESRFRRQLARFQPQAVILEYVTLAYLAKAARSLPESPTMIVDTHDVQSDRDEAFRREGWHNWLAITESQEAQALAQADHVMAIQSRDAQRLHGMCPNTNVSCVGHPAPAGIERTPLPTDIAPTLGFFAGRGKPNLQALGWLMDSVWPKVQQRLPDARLMIAGTICESQEAKELRDGAAKTESQVQSTIEWRGRVEQPSDFYRDTHLIANPVWIESGLKIKSVEALAYGRGLVTTTAGAMGLEAAIGSSIDIASDPNAFARAIVNRLGEDRQSALNAASEAERFAAQYLQANHVYRELMTAIDEPLADAPASL